MIFLFLKIFIGDDIQSNYAITHNFTRTFIYNPPAHSFTQAKRIRIKKETQKKNDGIEKGTK